MFHNRNYHNDQSVEFVPAGDGHYIKVPSSHHHHDLADYFYEHAAEQYPFDIVEISDDEDEDYSDNEDNVVYDDCHLVSAHDPHYLANGDLDEDLLSDYEREILHKRQRAATIVQTAATGVGALAGYAVAGPLGGAIGGGTGSFIGEAISPTPGKQWNAGRVGKKMLWGALAGGVSPLILTGGLAPWAATIGGGLSGYWNAQR